MRRETRLALNRINLRFYRERADEFSESRRRPWRGWTELLPHLELTAGDAPAPAILDVGCGNGRFASFLAEEEHLSSGFRYTGIDASPAALERAQQRLRELLPPPVLLQHDVIASERLLPDALSGVRFDLIVLFGVLHHLPGGEGRRALLREASRHLAHGGRLAYSVWRFEHFERFRNKLVPWERFLAEAGSEIQLDRDDLEPGDHVMTWGGEGPAYRYCHAMSDAEAEGLPGELELEVVTRFDAEGRSGELNRYYLLRRS